MNDAINPIAFLPAQLMPTLQPLSGLEANLGTALVAPGSTSVDGDFARVLAESLGSLNQKMLSADTALQRLSTGAETNLHDVMMRLGEARSSLQLVLQVRNRLVEAYSELTRMQI